MHTLPTIHLRGAIDALAANDITEALRLIDTAILVLAHTVIDDQRPAAPGATTVVLKDNTMAELAEALAAATGARPARHDFTAPGIACRVRGFGRALPRGVDGDALYTQWPR